VKSSRLSLPLIAFFALLVGSCGGEINPSLLASAPPGSICKAEVAMGEVEAALTKVAAADAEEIADPNSSQHAAALDALDRLDDYIREAEEALAVTPRATDPALRDDLAAAVKAAKAVSRQLRDVVESGDITGIEAAIAAAAKLQPDAASILAQIEALDVECPNPTPSPTATPTLEPTPSPEPTASPTAEPTASPTAEPTPTPTA